MNILILILLFLVWAVPGSAGSVPAGSPPPVPVYGYRVLASYPHDPGAFTQGLVIADGVLYEGTGLNGRSTLRRVDLETGAVLQNHPLPPEFFGEGVAVFGNRVIQLTWRSGLGFVYDRDTFALQRTFLFAGEGWGLTSDGRSLIASDGTATLRFLDPVTFQEQRRLTVMDGQAPVVNLNELEYVAGKIYANVWQTERIAIIDAASGRVTAWLDLHGLLTLSDRSRPVDVLNGIAYDQRTDRLYVTGKLWSSLFAIEPVSSLRQGEGGGVAR